MNSSLSALFIWTSTLFNLPPGLQSAICWVESGHNVRAMHFDDNGANSVGVCQIRLSTARLLGFQGSEQDLRLPRNNVYYSGKYLHSQYLRYNRNILKTISAYNAGSAPLNEKGQIRNIRYVNKVLRAWLEKK